MTVLSRPDFSILPNGYLRDLVEVHRREPAGYVGASLYNVMYDVPVLGWGATREVALLSALDLQPDRRNVGVFVCRPELRAHIEAAGFDFRSTDIMAQISDGIAYDVAELFPPHAAREWADDVAGSNRRIETSDGDWPAMRDLLVRMAMAHLKGSRMVGIADTGLLGWTDEAPLRGLGIASAAGIAPLSPLLVQAERETVVNLGAWEIETQLGDFMDMERREIGQRLRRA